MNFKKKVNGSWADTPHYIHKTDTDTITTLPADIYPNDTTATVGLKGQTVQNGTPTPQNPVMPNGCGGRTGNLFDKNGEVLTGSGAYINIISTGIRTIIQTVGSNRYSSIKLDNELLGKIITISSTITQSANNKGQIRLYYVNGKYATSLLASITTAGVTGYISSTLTMPSSIPSGSDGIAIVLSADRNGDGNIGDYVEYADLMIVEGSTAPSSYIPYGIKIPISSGGENLWDEAYTGINTNAIYKPLFVSDGVFTLSTNFKPNNNITDIFLLSGNVSSGINSSTNGAYEGKNITAQSVDGYITIAYRANARTGSGSLPYCKTMLNRGSTAIPYEPYNRTTTPVYLGEVETTRNIKKMVLTGDENFNTDTYLRFSIYVADIKTSTSRTGRSYCSHYECLYHAEPYDDDWNNVYYQSGGTLYFHDRRFSAVADFKSYLAAQYAAGTPVTVWYVLATEETGIVNEPLMKIGNYADEVSNISIPVTAGGDTLSVDTTVQPSEVTVNYKGWHPATDVHEFNNGTWT